MTRCLITPSAATQIRPFQAADRDGVMALAPRLTEWVSDWWNPMRCWPRPRLGERLGRPGRRR